MASLEIVEEQITKKVRIMIATFEALKVRNQELEREVSELRRELEETQGALKDCRKELADLKVIKATKVSDEERRRMHNRMLKLEREVEKCISLLNE